MRRPRPRVRALVLAAATALAGLVAVPLAAPPAHAAAFDGLTPETASPSCWAIKQTFPSSPDGIYWLRTPKLVYPQQFYCDQTTDGGGWVLVGRGRQGWSFNYAGQRSAANVRNPIDGTSAFPPAALPTEVVDGLMNGGRMDGLTDGIRIRRATNSSGTSWQEARWFIQSFGSWSWGFGGGIYLGGACFDGQCQSYSMSQTGYGGQSTRDLNWSNDTRRMFTYPWSSHNWQAGFSFGSNISGSNDSTSYLWQYTSERNAIPFSQVFIRPRISTSDVVEAHAPDAGIAASTLRPMLANNPVAMPWGVTGIDVGVNGGNTAYVFGFAQWGNRMFVGGKFLQVQRGIGGPRYDQRYLAAFDVNTGEWIDTFRPVLDGPVLDLDVTADGKLIAGGEFLNVNGQPMAGLAAINPTTGANVAGWSSSIDNPSGTAVRAFARAIDVQGSWVYLGGNFHSIRGGNPVVGPITVGNLARVRTSDGRPDGLWKPNVEGYIWDLDANSPGTRVYAVGNFRTLNGVNLPQPRLAILDTSVGDAVPGLQPWQPNADLENEQTILEVGSDVYLGGAQHIVHKYRQSDFAFQRSHLTRAGGDYQAMSYKDGILYASCHCTNWNFTDSNTWSTPRNYTRVDPINLIGAYDTATFDYLREWRPNIRHTGTGGEGPWKTAFDSNGCLWAGGDLLRAGASASSFYGGFEKICDRDSTAPSVPTNFRVTASGASFTLGWNASTDNVTASSGIRYEILRDDPVYGTVVARSQFGRSYVAGPITAPTRFFVRAADAAGNRSATTSVLLVSPPTPTIGTFVATNATWRYRADGANQGTAWRQPGFDTSSWASGAAELGWGDGGEATVIPTGAITQYFVRQFTVNDPSQVGSMTLRIRRDDGAVAYINGLEVARTNMPTGPIASNTVAASYVSGADESNYQQLVVPAANLVAGTNTVAVELHQAQANNGDASFALELVGNAKTEAVSPTTPNASLAGRTASSISLSWTPSTDASGVIGYRIRRGGVDIAFTNGTSWVDGGLAIDTQYSYEVRAVDPSGNTSGAGSLTARTLPDPTLLAYGAAWRWRYDGVDQGTAWRGTGFDDSSWSVGNAELGFGDGGEATVIYAGGAPTPMTAYFRRTFDVSDRSAIASMLLDVIRDDGAVVYVNGVEVARTNMPAGTITSTTAASSGLSTNGQEQTPATFTIPTAALVDGTNTIAVEVHQFQASSVDLSFNLRLLANFA